MDFCERISHFLDLAVDDVIDSLERLAVSKPTSRGAGSRGVGKSGGGGSGKGRGGGSGKGRGGGSGLYIIKFKGFKERYVGRTCDIDQCTKEHKRSIVKGTGTVGKFCEKNGLSVDDIEIDFRPMEGTLTEIRYQEQKLMNKQPYIINKIAAMNRKAYEIEKKKRSSSSLNLLPTSTAETSEYFIAQWNLSNSNTLGPDGVRVRGMFKL